MGISDLSLYDILVRNALIHGNRPAWFEANQERLLTYNQLKRQVDQQAACLQATGLAHGDRLGLVGQNSLDYFLTCAAAAALGAVVVPINWRLSAREAAVNLNDVTPSLILAEHDDPAWLADVQSHMTNDTPCFNFQSGKGPLKDLPRAEAEAFDPARPEQVASEDPAVIIHTAAVDGRPRGAVLSHNNMIAANLHLLHGLGADQDTVYLNALPLFHVAGLCVTWMTLHLGALVVNMRRFDAGLALDLISTHKVSLMFEFAPMLDTMLTAWQRKGSDLRSLKKVAGLDAPPTIARYQQLTGGRYFSLYGQTETSMVVSMAPYDNCPGSAGRPMPLTKIAVVDEADRPLPPGETGEIVVRGPIVFKGYWGMGRETETVFRNGWHHTGDLGRLDYRGFLWYCGRKPEKELIKPGGENVYPSEVENVLMQHPAVATAVVFGVPDPKWKEGIKAVCQLKPGHTATAEDLIAFVGDRIARYKKPHYVDFVSELPLQSNGRIDRAAVKNRYAR